MTWKYRLGKMREKIKKENVMGSRKWGKHFPTEKEIYARDNQNWVKLQWLINNSSGNYND